MTTSLISTNLRRGCVGLLVLAQLASPVGLGAITPFVEPVAAQATHASTTRPSPPPHVRVNRIVPRVTRRPAALTFTSTPSDTEFYEVRVFAEPLVPVGAPTNQAENRELARALEAYLRQGRPESAAPVLEFLQRHPFSPWRPSLMANLATEYYAAGYFSRALRNWEAAWEQTKGDVTPTGHRLADFALGKWLEAMSQLGHLAPLKARLAEIAGRDIVGGATVHVEVARQSVWFLENRHHEAIASGPGALDRLLQSESQRKEAYRTPDAIARYHATPEGISLTQLQSLASRLGKPLRMAFRPAGAPVAVPSIVHFSVDHFATVVAVKGDRYHLSDATLGDRTISRAMLDSEASGFVLVPEGALPDQWRPVESHEGRVVFGKCRPRINTPGDDAGAPRTPSPCARTCVTGMAAYDFHPIHATVRLYDTPVGYQPPRGPAVPIEISYNEVDGTTHFPWHGNFGDKWTFSWHSYVEEKGWGTFQVVPWYVSVYLRGSGKEHYADTGLGLMPDGGSSRARLVRASFNPIRYERHLPDGTVEVFAQSDGAEHLRRRVLLSEVISPTGQSVQLTYDSLLRLVAITDALGQVTTFVYDHPTDQRKITSVTDPFDRTASFEYAAGRLVKIVDTLGMASSFAYAGNDAVRTLTTPYGITTFNRQSVSGVTSLDITDAMGGRERLEYHDLAAGVAATAPVSEVPSGFESRNVDLNRRLSIYWSKRALALFPGDKSKAVLTNWLLKGPVVSYSHDTPITMSIPASIKRPLEKRVWFSYPGQVDPTFVGLGRLPDRVGRKLDDGATQVHEATYNDLGRVTSVTDPLGRRKSFSYAANLTDLLEIRQTTGTASELLATFGNYTAGHAPQEITDAAGQQMAVSYNSAGQVQTVTNAKGETTTSTYTDGYPTGVSGPLGATWSFTYDGYGRVRTTTDVDGYTTTHDYDLFDRPTRTTYPDGTYEEATYTRLNLTAFRDRRGRVTRYFFDQLGRLTSTRDPAGRVVSQEWCKCGTLDGLIDGKGQKTTWERDAQNRVVRELQADGATATVFTYEASTSRLKEVTDPKQQVVHYTYALDDSVTGITYTNVTVATPSVSYTYDSVYPRLTTIVDGTGTTTLDWRPIGALGAGQLASVDGPLANDVVTYGHDQLGRVTSRTVDGVPLTVTYDALGRVTQEANAMGTFLYGYVSATQRLASVEYPNGQTSAYNYRANLEDRRLETIHHKRPGGATLSRFDLTYDAAGQILTKTQQADSEPATRWTYTYDAVDQLIGAVHTTTGASPTELARYAYAYDTAGNRTLEQFDDSVATATHDALNRLQTHVVGGALRIAGTLNESATVNVAGRSMAVHADQTFSGNASVTSGTNTLTLTATDPSGNTSTKTYEVDVFGTGQTFVYDANGNLISDGARTFSWNANDQLAAVVQGATRVEFGYNSQGYRTSVREFANDVLTTESWYVWTNGELAEERVSNGSAVGRRIFAQGTVDGSDTLFQTRDHLGSVSEVTNAIGLVEARYAYDPYGVQTRVTGTHDSSFGFTGHFRERALGLLQAHFRSYDPHLGRWLSSDPLGYVDGPNAHAYVRNNPVNAIDPEGLAVEIWFEFLRPGSNALGSGMALSGARHAYIRVTIPGEVDDRIELAGWPNHRTGLPSRNTFNYSHWDDLRGLLTRPPTDPCGDPYQFERDILKEFERLRANHDLLPDYRHELNPPFGRGINNSNTFARHLIEKAGGKLWLVPPGAHGVWRPFQP